MELGEKMHHIKINSSKVRHLKKHLVLNSCRAGTKNALLWHSRTLQSLPSVLWTLILKQECIIQHSRWN